MYFEFQDAKGEVKELENLIEEIHHLSNTLATYFCEDKGSFKLEECLDTIRNFCDKIKQCQQVRA